MLHSERDTGSSAARRRRDRPVVEEEVHDAHDASLCSTGTEGTSSGDSWRGAPPDVR